MCKIFLFTHMFCLNQRCYMMIAIPAVTRQPRQMQLCSRRTQSVLNLEKISACSLVCYIKANYGQTGGRSSFVRTYRGSNLINRGWSHEPLDHIFYNYHDGILDSQPAISMTGSDSMKIWWMQYEGFEGQTDQGSWMAMYNSLTGNDTGYSMTIYKP